MTAPKLCFHRPSISSGPQKNYFCPSKRIKKSIFSKNLKSVICLNIGGGQDSYPDDLDSVGPHETIRSSSVCRTRKDPIEHRMAGDIKIDFEKQISRSESTTSSIGSLSNLHQVIDTGTLLCDRLFYGWFLVNGQLVQF